MRERFGQDLDRDVAVQLGVARAKDLPHAPFADRRDDFVNAQTGAEGEGQRWDYMAGATARTGLLLENAADFRFCKFSEVTRRQGGSNL